MGVRGGVRVRGRGEGGIHKRSKWEKEMSGLETYIMLCSSFCFWKHLWKLACVLSSLYML